MYFLHTPVSPSIRNTCQPSFPRRFWAFSSPPPPGSGCPPPPPSDRSPRTPAAVGASSWTGSAENKQPQCEQQPSSFTFTNHQRVMGMYLTHFININRCKHKLQCTHAVILITTGCSKITYMK